MSLQGSRSNPASGTHQGLRSVMAPIVVPLINALYLARRLARPKRPDSGHSFLAEAGILLASSADYESKLARVARLIIPSLADWCIVDLSGDDGRFHCIGSAHIDPAKEELLRQVACGYSRGTEGEHPIWNRLIESGMPVLFPSASEAGTIARCQEPAQIEATELIHALGGRSGMGVLLQARGRVLGAITLVYASSGRTYGQRELEVAVDLAQRAALAIDNAILYREAQEAYRVREEFLSIVSHELRTPLNTILCWARLLRTRDFDRDTTARALEIIERNATAQAQLIADILEVSRMITGKLSLNVCRMNPVRTVEAALKAVHPAAKAKSIRMECSLDPSIGMISGDPDRMQQVVWNLLSNAIKFTPRGGRISVSLANSDSSVRLTVADTGQGIGTDLLPHLFEHFRQGESSTTRSHGGLGLGLAIVRHLVELHGGRVVAESPGDGKGATFTVDLPVTRAECPSGFLSIKPRTFESFRNAL